MVILAQAAHVFECSVFKVAELHSLTCTVHAVSEFIHIWSSRGRVSCTIWGHVMWGQCRDFTDVIHAVKWISSSSYSTGCVLFWWAYLAGFQVKWQLPLQTYQLFYFGMKNTHDIVIKYLKSPREATATPSLSFKFVVNSSSASVLLFVISCSTNHVFLISSSIWSASILSTLQL